MVDAVNPLFLLMQQAGVAPEAGLVRVGDAAAASAEEDAHRDAAALDDLVRARVASASRRMETAMLDGFAGRFEQRLQQQVWPRLEQLEASLANAANRAGAAGITLSQQTDRLVSIGTAAWWRIMAVAVAACIIGVFGSAWLVWSNLQQAEAARMDAERSRLLSSIVIGECGGKPCVQLDDTAKRWGRDGDYVILKTVTADAQPPAESSK